MVNDNTAIAYASKQLFEDNESRIHIGRDSGIVLVDDIMSCSKFLQESRIYCRIWYSGKHLMTEKDNVFHSFVHSQPPSVFLRCIVLGTVHVPWLPQIRASMDEVILATA